MFERQDELAPGLLAGTLEGLSVPDLMWALCRGQADGVLRVSREGVRKTLYLEQGRIVFAASSDPDDRLGELLLRKGWVLLDQLESALGSLGSGKRLGTILVEAGHLSPENLVNGVLTQVREIAMDLFTWEAGEYAFEPGPLPTQEVITLAIGTGELLLQGIRRIRSFSRIRRSVGRPRTVYRMRPSGRELVDGLSLTAGEEQLLTRLEGGAESIETLCQDVYLSNFEVYQTLWALKVLGAVEVEDRPGTIVDDAAVAGRFGAETIAPVLVRLCRSGETGVLYVSRGSLERTMHVRDGQVVFATSNDIDDGLVAYLLRRGVISLRDREETAKRLLSNKRVGTILREMGVIDELDLRNMVREHLCEILHDTVAWARGEYAFVPGELPTVEEITLDVTLESLVAAGLHRITSWSRVRDGIGGIRQRLELSPDFLSVLDRMSIGPAEWEVVTSLKEPRTAMEVCRQTGLGDFRVTQILWSLRMLGAVTPAQESAGAMDARGDAAEVMMPAAMAIDESAPEPVAAAAEAAPEENPAAADGPEGEEREEPSSGPTGDASAAAAAHPVEIEGNEAPPEFEFAEPVGARDDTDAAQDWLQDDQDRDAGTFEVARLGEETTDTDGDDTGVPAEPREDSATPFEVGAPGSGPSEDEAAAAWLPSETPPPPVDFQLADPGEDPGARDGEPVETGTESRDERTVNEDPIGEPVFVLSDPDVESAEEPTVPTEALSDDRSASEPAVHDTPDVDDLDGGNWSGRRKPDVEPGWAAGGAQDAAEVDEAPGDTTQIISRDEVDAALGRETSPDVTQAIDPELVRRVLAGSPAGAAGAFAEPDLPEGGVNGPAEEDASFEPAVNDPADAVEAEANETSVTPADDVEPSDPVGGTDRFEAFDPAGNDPADAVEAEANETSVTNADDTESSDPVGGTDRFEAFEPAVNDPADAVEAEANETAVTPADDAEPSDPVGGTDRFEAFEPAVNDPADAVEAEANETAVTPADDAEPSDPVGGTDRIEAFEPAGNDPAGNDPAEGGSVPTEAVTEASETTADDAEPLPRDEQPEPVAVDRSDDVDRFDEAAPSDDEPHEAWMPPENLESTIARFNARQRVLYRTIRAEVGAGAVNFIRSCCGKVGSSPSDLFEGVDLRSDGTWDADALRQAAIEQRVEDPCAEYERLLDLEFELLKIQIGDARAQALREQMDRAAVQPAQGPEI